LDDSLVVRSVYPTHDGEFPDPRPVRSEPLRLEAGRSYRLRVDAQESYGDAQLHLLWSTPHEMLETDALRAAGEADVVVLCLGLTAQLEGEEMRVEIEGFRGGDNPGGRLPLTFYKSVADLPPFDDYRMEGRTYRFFTGTPLYPFGYGLSYTSFAYQNLRTSADTLAAGDTLTVRVDVTNTGKRAGDEVVQLYVRHLGSSVARPREDLRGYKRITL